MRRFPLTLDTDTTEVRDALEIARTQYNRGALDDAMRWLHRAADIAYEQRHDERAASLANSLGALSPPRPAAARAPTESARSRAPEPMPVNPTPARLGAAPARPAAASSAPRSVAPRSAQATERTASPASKPPNSGLPRSIVPSRPVPIPQGAFEAPSDAFLPPDDASTSEAFPLVARKVEPFNLDDDATHVGAAPAGLLAALAAERQAPAKAPAPAPTRAPPRATPSASPAAPRPAVAPKSPAQPVGPTAAAPKPAPQPAAPQPAAPKPAPQAAAPSHAHAPQAAVHALVDDDDDDQTSPGISPKAIHAMITEAKARPVVHQALRVALSKGPHGVVARAIGGDGLRAGEVEVMVVGAAAEADVAALFAG